MSVTASKTGPLFRPKSVAKFLGIPGAHLPRTTYNTVELPAKPSVRRGGRGTYSFVDVILMRLGQTLLDHGLLPARTRECIRTVRSWIQEVLEDPLFGTETFDQDKKWRWLIGTQKKDGFSIILGDKNDLIKAVLAEESARLHITLNLYKFVGIEGKKLLDFENTLNQNEKTCQD